MMLRYKNGARGALWASQVAVGNENGVKLRVYGTKGGISWRQENPNELFYSPFGQSTRIITRGGPDSGEAAGRVTRIPPGHPEGYLEGFANIYSEVAQGDHRGAGGQEDPQGGDVPDHRRRRQRHGVRRGGGEVVKRQRQVGEGIGGSAFSRRREKGIAPSPVYGRGPG